MLTKCLQKNSKLHAGPDDFFGRVMQPKMSKIVEAVSNSHVVLPLAEPKKVTLSCSVYLEIRRFVAKV